MMRGGSSTRPPQERGPSGRPISSRLRVPEGDEFRPVREALQIIDAVHGDGVPPMLEVRLTASTREAGAYLSRGRPLQPVALELSRRVGSVWTVLHEIGHCLDEQGVSAS